MSRQPTSFSTIIVVNKTQEETRSLQIKTRHLKRLKHYALTLVFIFSLLITAVIYLFNSKSDSENEKQRLLAQIETIKGKLKSAPKPEDKAAEASVAQSYIQSIQGKLKKINTYLKKRGLGEFAIKAIGGDPNSADNRPSATDEYAAYDDYLGKLVRNVAFTPMGYPRISAINSIFGYRSDPFDNGHAEYHPGIDFSGHRGDPVKSTANGKVIFTGWRNGYGNCIIIKHTHNFETLYGHLSHIDVRNGQSVTTGDVIGRVGSTGRSTGPHLHYEVRVNGKPVNPTKFLSLNR